MNNLAYRGIPKGPVSAVSLPGLNFGHSNVNVQNGNSDLVNFGLAGYLFTPNANWVDRDTEDHTNYNYPWLKGINWNP